MFTDGVNELIGQFKLKRNIVTKSGFHVKSAPNYGFIDEINDGKNDGVYLFSLINGSCGKDGNFRYFIVPIDAKERGITFD